MTGQGAAVEASISEAAGSDSIVDYGTTRDGLIQLRRRWPALGRPRAVVYVLHGISEHSGRYDHVGRALAARGFEVVATDHRGHGSSGGRRAHVGRWAEYLDDVTDQLGQIRRLGLPVVMLAHSMGGLIALSYCVEGRPPPDLLVTSGPALGYGGGPARYLVRMVGPALRRVAPNATVRSGIDPWLLSTDPGVGEKLAADPLWNRGTTISLGHRLLEAMERTRRDIDRLSVPTLCIHGGDDRLVPIASSEILASVAGAQRRVYEGLRHEVFNEPTGLDVLAEVIDWIDTELTRAETGSEMGTG